MDGSMVAGTSHPGIVKAEGEAHHSRTLHSASEFSDRFTGCVLGSISRPANSVAALYEARLEETQNGAPFACCYEQSTIIRNLNSRQW